MVASRIKKTVNELGARTTYELFLEKEGIPAIQDFHIEDIRETEVYPWPRVGGRGVYLNLEGTEGINDCYIAEIAPGEVAQSPKIHVRSVDFCGQWPGRDNGLARWR